jgi:8-oxo-dGTP diphosphatase
MKPTLINYWNFKDKEYRFDVYMSGDFSNIGEVNQVYGFVISEDNKNLLVGYNKEGIWLPPGGGVEEGETLLNTLKREVKEESNRDVDINTVTPFFYQKCFVKDEKGRWEYMQTQVRYIVKVSNDLEFEHDPDDGDIIKVKWIPIEDVDKYLDWKGVIEKVKEELPKYIDKLNN